MGRVGTNLYSLEWPDSHTGGKCTWSTAHIKLVLIPTQTVRTTGLPQFPIYAQGKPLLVPRNKFAVCRGSHVLSQDVRTSRVLADTG